MFRAQRTFAQQATQANEIVLTTNYRGGITPPRLLTNKIDTS